MFLLFAVVDILLFRKYRKTKRPEAIRNTIDISSIVLNAKHQSGLPLPQDFGCVIRCGNDTIIISGGGNTFELKIEKITDISIKTDVDIRRQYVSSVGRAAAGREVFGLLGAIVGGRAKEKTTRTYRYYLIFTYLSNDGIAYVSFEISYSYVRKAEQLKEYLRGQMATGISVDL